MEGKLDFEPYYKPTNTFNYQHFDCAHSTHVEIGLAMGEITRILRLSSDNNIYIKHATKLFLTLLNIGYSRKKMKYLFAQYHYGRKHSLLNTNKKLNKEIADTVRLICDFHPAYPTRTVKEALQGPPDWLVLTHSHTKMLATTLVQSRLLDTPPSPTGAAPQFDFLRRR